MLCFDMILQFILDETRYNVTTPVKVETARDK